MVGVFTAIGGNSAVSYLGMIQGVVMIIGSAFCVQRGLAEVGGLQSLNLKLAAADAALVQFVGNVPPAVWWNLLLVFGLAQFSNPHLIPRFFSLRSGDAARLALPLSIAVNCLWVLAAVLIGLVVRVQSPGLSSGDQAMPLFLRTLPPALSFVILLALLSAIFSTIDTLLLAVGSNIAHDVIKGAVARGLSERCELIIAKFSMLAVSAVCFGLLITLINSFAMGAFILILGVPLVMGLFFVRVTKQAAISAAAGGPIIYVAWRYTLAPVTGIGEMVASLALVIPLVVFINFMSRPQQAAIARKVDNGIENAT